MTTRQKLDEIYSELEKDLPKLPLGDSGEPTVPGDGNAEAEIMFIGEAPGYNESVQRKPFVGRSGQLFIKTLEAVGYPRPDVYITNIVKVRPPENRDPTPEEILAYKPYLDREIAAISPKIIITLGRLSMGKFLPGVKITQVHGRLHKVNWNNSTLFILPMYHPAAALRGTQMQQAFVTDFQKIPKILEWIAQHGKSHKSDDELEEEIKRALL